MALGTNNYTFADLDVAIPEIWGQIINDYFRYSLELANFFIDRSDELIGGGDTIHTVNNIAFTTNTKTNGSEVTLQSPTLTDVDLVVSTWKEASFLIEDREMKQLKQSYRMQETIAKGAAYEVAQDLDSALATLFSGFSTTVGASTTNVADSEILAAIATLETTGVPGIYTGDVAFIFHPNTFYRQIGNIDKMTLWQNTGSEKVRVKQPTRMLYGIPVIVTPAVPNVSGSDGRVNVLAHQDAIHWAKLPLGTPSGVNGMVGTEGVRVLQSYVHEYLGTLVTCDICYGTIENRDDAAVIIYSHATAA